MGWLAGFFQFIYEVSLAAWPFSWVRATQRGVRFTRGKNPVVLQPGLRRDLAFFDELGLVDIRPIWIDCPDQPLTTVDNETIIISGMILIVVFDPYLFIMANADTLDALKALVMAKQATKVSTMEYRDTTVASIERAVVRSLRRSAEQWGVRVIEYSINQHARAGDGVFWHAGDGPALAIPGQEDEDE